MLTKLKKLSTKRQKTQLYYNVKDYYQSLNK